MVCQEFPSKEAKKLNFTMCVLAFHGVDSQRKALLLEARLLFPPGILTHTALAAMSHINGAGALLAALKNESIAEAIPTDSIYWNESTLQGFTHWIKFVSALQHAYEPSGEYIHHFEVNSNWVNRCPVSVQEPMMNGYYVRPTLSR